jgi:2-polyprenyl-6-methoxyphenol hydroxylase-like FAD-dependent oxidoreductase
MIPVEPEAGRRRAVVAGASIAGLLAARALASRFEEVLVVDRDPEPSGAEPRRGAPHAAHSHALLPSGRAALESQFPGLSKELAALGVPCAGTRALRWVEGGGTHARYDRHGSEGLYVSRPLLEQALRMRVAALPNVRFAWNTRVCGPLLDEDEPRVTGDAAGRGGHAVRWLLAHGIRVPDVSRVDLRIHYSTRLFRRHPEQAAGDLGVVIAPDPGTGRGAVMLAQEGERWSVTLIHVGDAQPPIGDEAFLAAARALPDPSIAQVIAADEPIGPIVQFGSPGSQRHHFERLSLAAEGLIAIGDAFASFNPIYGQGMSVAARQALALGECLDAGGRVARRFHRRSARMVDQAWTLLVAGDFRFPAARGVRARWLTVLHAYLAWLHRAARHDPRVASAFTEVAFLQQPAYRLVYPRMLWRVLRQRWRSASPVSAPAMLWGE